MASLSKLYLKSLGYIFTIAFLSYYVQYPALSSRSGIEPSEGIFRHSLPLVYDSIVAKGFADADSLVELVNVLGVVLSIAIASGIIQHGLLFLTVTIIYRFLVVLGTSFYTFQWDILLVEAGFLTGICFAPWRTITLTSEEHEQEIGSWPIRFLLFKLMFMSGVVKIQANCPTWNNLTALEYHFATQCLPGPLAWYAHNLHPFLLRLGVAATFVIEIPAAYLLLSPFATMRKVGAWLQILLQILIILTGSYNFFNLLTIAICIPCIISGASHIPGNERGRNEIHYSQIWHGLQIAVSTLGLARASKEMITLERITDPMDSQQRIGLKLAIDKYDCNHLVEQTIPIAVACTLVFVSGAGIRDVMQRRSNRLYSILHTFVCCICIVITAVPFLEMSPNLNQTAMKQFPLGSSAWMNVRRYSRHVSHGYGLFRRMTGVGRPSINEDHASNSGWAGLPPSVVERPEIILEGKVGGSEEWRELNFRWKPGKINQWPLQVAPHQPRLDWRMWFAALGSVQNNAWFVSFVDKLLSGCPIVMDILNEPRIGNITQVRASLYHYDFTRLDTEWARRIPDTTIVTSLMPNQVWSRKLVGQYLPPLDSNNQSLKDFLRHAGYTVPSKCASNEDRCLSIAEQGPCILAKSLREMNDKYSLFILIALVSFCIVESGFFSRQNKEHSKLKSE